MISVMANACVEFDNGEEKVVTVLGFNRLPDWVAGTDYFKLCSTPVLGKPALIHAFEGSSDKSMQKADAIRAENKALREKIKALQEKAEMETSDETLKAVSLKKE